MINIIKKFLFFALTLLIVAFSGYFIYKSYTAYQNYQIAQISEKYILFIKSLNATLHQVEQERSLSALYLGTEGNSNFNQLEMVREKTDNVIQNITQFIKNNPKFSSYSKNMAKLSDNLQYVRSRVDVISSDYEDIFFTYYQDEISKSLLDDIKSSANELSFGVKSLEKYLFSYINFIEFRNSIEKEKSFIAFILSRSKKMNKLDLVLWDTMLKKEIIPILTNLDNKTAVEIKTQLQPESFSQLSFKIRVDIAKGASKGYYTTKINRWLENANEKIKRVKQSEKIILKYLKDKTNNIILSPKEIILYLSISLFLIFLLLSILFSSKKRKKNKNFQIDKERRKEARKSIPIEDRREVKQHISQTNDMFYTDMSLNNKEDNLIQSPKPLPLIDNQTNMKVDEVNSFNALKNFNQIVEYFVKTSKKNIEVDYYIDPAIPTSCIGDFSKIKQILDNLISHAIKSTKSYGSVKIRINNTAQKKSQSAIGFTITAPNSYISKEQKQIIMKAFYQKNRVQIKKSKSAISDLSQSSELISLMDGVFGIKSNPKEGTTFSFTLLI